MLTDQDAHRGRPRDSKLAASADRPWNLNTASQAELETLPGVGPVTAERIVRYREESGGITSVEQLRTLKLVNEATFAKLSDLVTVQ